jgi:hypothetical protein
LLDVIRDEEFLTTEDYSVPKAHCEDFLRNQCAGQNWTIVRPVISFSQRRLDLYMYSGRTVLEAAKKGETLLLPAFAKDYKAGLDWAGNSGKLIANLFLKQDAMGEAFTIYSGQGLTWGQVAETYERLIGLQVRWCDEAEFLADQERRRKKQKKAWGYFYDRYYNRDVDCSKVLGCTGLSKADFATIEEGLRTELALLGETV